MHAMARLVQKKNKRNMVLRKGGEDVPVRDVDYFVPQVGVRVFASGIISSLDQIHLQIGTQEPLVCEPISSA